MNIYILEDLTIILGQPIVERNERSSNIFFGKLYTPSVCSKMASLSYSDVYSELAPFHFRPNIIRLTQLKKIPYPDLTLMKCIVEDLMVVFTP